MCYFCFTKFPCGCISWKGSEYKYCAARGKGCETKLLEKFEWQTFCPDSRKALKGKKKFDDTVAVPKCCVQLDKATLNSLCIKCNSIPHKDEEHHCYCPWHMVSVSAQVERDAEEEFEKAVQLWPGNLRARYLRRKQDVNARDCGWSL